MSFPDETRGFSSHLASLGEMLKMRRLSPKSLIFFLLALNGNGGMDLQGHSQLEQTRMYLKTQHTRMGGEGAI